MEGLYHILNIQPKKNDIKALNVNVFIKPRFPQDFFPRGKLMTTFLKHVHEIPHFEFIYIWDRLNLQ